MHLTHSFLAIYAAMAVPSSSLNRASENPSMAIEDPLRAASSHVAVERRGDYSAQCKWTIANFLEIQSRALWSEYFEVGGFHCRLIIYPRGDSQAQPGNLSMYLQIMNPRNRDPSDWDCFASYRLAIGNFSYSSKSSSVVMQRDSWHQFSSKGKSHGWCDFASFNSLSDPNAGFLHLSNDSILITADISILHDELFSFSRDNCDSQSNHVPVGGVIGPVVEDALSCGFTWKVHNFGLFREMIKTQKITSPVFPVGECDMRISVYESEVSGVEYLSMCLESNETDKNSLMSDSNCWCLFSVYVLNQKPGNGLSHVRCDSYGRFAGDNKCGDNTSLGWSDFMKMADFMEPESGFFVEDTAVFSASLHVIKESSSFTKSDTLIGARNGGNDGHMGKFTWRIEDFTLLKDLLEKMGITGLCIKSRIFQIGSLDCRLIVYPRGQSHESPSHLSVFLEVIDSQNTNNDWSCFVSHRLSVVNQRMEEKSVAKESQNRYSKAAKDWGWREFITLTNLFDKDNGFLVQDAVVFSAEVLILKETSIEQDFTDQLEKIGKRSSFAWKVENFLSFKEIMETRKIFSKFFQAGGCELRIGIYISFDTICIYLENDQSSGGDSDKNFWVRYRMDIVNQKNPSKTVGKESSICTKTWDNSVLRFMKVSDMLEDDAGFLVGDTVVLVCEILDCCPWFEFSGLELPERQMLAKERSSGTYRLSSYFLALSLGDLPMELVLPTVFFTITYWMAGLKPSGLSFISGLFALLYNVLCSQSLGLAIGAAVMDQKAATTLGSVIMLTFLLAGGYYVQHVPVFISWIKYISISQYAFKLLLGTQYKIGQEYACGEGKTCLVQDFPMVKSVGLGDQGIAVVALGVMIVGYRIIAYLALMRIGVTKKRHD